MKDEKGISVVLATHYRPKLLRKTLKAVLAQDYPKDLFEAIVVGFNGDKSIGRVEKDFGEKGIKFFRIDSTFVDKKRNFGAKKARFEIIAFTDDDCIPEKRWLKAISECFKKDSKVVGVEGLTWNDNKKLYCHAPENLTGERYLACNYAFKKNAFALVKGFDEQYHMNYREDTDLAFKMLAKGMKLVFCKKAKVYHPPLRQSLTIPFRDLRLVRNDVLLYKKFPKLFRERFGFVCRGFFKLSAAAWAAAFFALASIYFWNAFLPFFSLAGIIGLKFFVEKKGKKASVWEWSLFIAFSYTKDLLFPFYFLHYWVSVKPKEERRVK